MTGHGKDLRRLRDGLHELEVLVDQLIAQDNARDDDRIIRQLRPVRPFTGDAS